MPSATRLDMLDRKHERRLARKFGGGVGMDTKSRVDVEFDFDKFRLRTFVDCLIELDEVEIRDDPVPLTGLSEIIESTPNAVLFKQAGPERLELISKVAASRKRIVAAFATTEDEVYDEFHKRLANPQIVVEVPSDEAPVHEVTLTGDDVDLTKLPFHPHELRTLIKISWIRETLT